MKQAFSALMMLLSLLIGFQQAVIVMLFKLNQATIEKEYCTNQSKPDLHCHGFCYLKKQLEGKGDAEPHRLEIYKRVDMLAVVLMEFQANHIAVEKKNQSPMYKQIYYDEPYREVLVPPPMS